MANCTGLYGIYGNNFSATNLLEVRKCLYSLLFYISARINLVIVLSGYLV